MPRKRKKVPVRMADEKRSCLSWNLHLSGNLAPATSTIDEVENEAHTNDPFSLTNMQISNQQLQVLHPHEISFQQYKALWDISDYSITIHDKSPPKSIFKIGTFSLQLSPHSLKTDEDCPLEDSPPDLLPKTLPSHNNFSLFTITENTKQKFYVVFDSDSNNENVNFGGPYICFDAGIESVTKDAYIDGLEVVCRVGRGKHFSVTKGEYCASKSSLDLEVWIGEVALKTPKFAAESSKLTHFQKCTQSVMEWLRGIHIEDSTGCVIRQRQDFDDVFKFVRKFHKEEDKSWLYSIGDVQHDKLVPKLREYQKEAVQWMIKKEKLINDKTKENELHCLWTKLDGSPLYYNANSGIFTRVKFLQPQSFPGGILADEMGLGKTVEVLALILNHKRHCSPNPEVNGSLRKCDNEKDLGTDVESLIEIFTEPKEESELSQMLIETVNGEPAGTGKPTSTDEPAGTGKLNSGSSTETSKPICNIDSTTTNLDVPMCNADSITPDRDVPMCNADSTTTNHDVPMSNGDSTTTNRDVPMCNADSTTTSLDVPMCDGEPAGEHTEISSCSDEETSDTDGEAAIPDKRHKPKNTKKSCETAVTGEPRILQCLCGMQEDYSDLVVQCVRCKVWQHTKCVNMDTDILDKQDYQCPHCWSLIDAVKSSATLIVTPAAICHQWVDEINRHVNLSAIKMLVYKGIKKHGYIQPKELASYDIVLTTYDKLSSELHYVDLPHCNDNAGRKLRHAKRYMATPSPLPFVEWWRVCLDEAQMIESPTAKSAEMALRLKAVNRWCITGTPIQRSMDDLYGLLLFIGVEPYWVKCWWDQLLCRPFYLGKTRPIQEAVAEVLWRTSKKDVIDQINLPPQTEERHWLKFSPVEQHFYKKQHSDCSGRFMWALHNLRNTDLKTKLCDVDRDTVQKLMNPLLRLRQACCHPQAVRGQFIPLQKDYLTMDQLLVSLQEKAKIESEECHRQLVCSLNGLAAVHIMKSEIVEAVEKYREVLRSSDEFKDKLRTDKLQLYHAMVNLHKLLDTKPAGVHPTLRDDQLKERASEIHDGYMAKALVKVTSAEENLKLMQETLQDLASQVTIDSNWWIDAIYLFQELELEDLITNKIKTDLEANATVGVVSIVNRFRDLSGLQFLVVRHLDLLKEKRLVVCETIDSLNCEPTDQLIQQCVECHRRDDKPKKTCPFCVADTVFDDYQVLLFAFSNTNKKVNGRELKKQQGTWAMNEVERILRTLLSCCKNVVSDYLVKEGTVHIETLESYRKEYKLLRGMRIALDNRVGALDELLMATTRLRVRHSWEPVDPKITYVIGAGQIEQQWYKLLNDHVFATNELRKKLSQQLYLANLATSGFSKQENGENPEQCPICVAPLGCQWTVLQCGHCFCNECMDIFIQRHSSIGSRKSIKCPTCRSSTYVTEISYISTRLKESDLNDNGVKVKGGHSTKIEAVIKTLLTIQMRQPGAKSIVFSTWTDVLDVIAQGLRDNDVDYRQVQYGGHPQFQSKLMEFKHDEKVTTLLLPVQSGAKGLNVIEATHVLLVEPILNVANELQAIGRVHRIGQTKPTVVHRFLIANTIEERIHAMLQTTQNNSSVNSSELELGGLSLGDLKDIFSDDIGTYCLTSDPNESGFAEAVSGDVPSTSTNIPNTSSTSTHPSTSDDQGSFLTSEHNESGFADGVSDDVPSTSTDIPNTSSIHPSTSDDQGS
ncbi:E3 ubiquitin-protein ligase SHPRH-like [Antedon mediterranea]|uniref:E3 ubiquitin-protein ligase SHPRH-like n=1 Tax=Antedon mediterranea TaxID=105859 RepID=UPI003AF5FDC0